MTNANVFGIDELRRAVRILDSCNEGVNQCFSAVELLKLVEMQLRSGWDFYIDQWDGRQLKEALAGTPPNWKENDSRHRRHYFGTSGYVPVYADGSSPTDEREECEADEEVES